MKLEIEKDRVLKAAEQCLEVKAVLKTLFPEAFKEELVFYTGAMFLVKHHNLELKFLVTLVNIEGKFCLVDLKTGKPFSVTIPTNVHSSRVTYKQLFELFGGDASNCPNKHYIIKEIEESHPVVSIPTNYLKEINFRNYGT